MYAHINNSVANTFKKEVLLWGLSLLNILGINAANIIKFAIKIKISVIILLVP